MLCENRAGSLSVLELNLIVFFIASLCFHAGKTQLNPRFIGKYYEIYSGLE